VIAAVHAHPTEREYMTVYNDAVSTYIKDLFAAEDEQLRFAREDSQARGLPVIYIKPEEGRFLQAMARLSGGRKIVEIGTLGGYSGIWIARGLVPGGRLITLEMNQAHADIARDHFQRAGVEDRVDIWMGNAHESLRKLNPIGPFDMVFIDAEKPGYQDYYDWAVENVRIGGLITAHNAFRKGSVMGLVDKDQYTDMTIVFNHGVASDPRVISTIYPAGDGTLLAVRIS
jgi:caffeoyl-CoA O-methyltransferase